MSGLEMISADWLDTYVECKDCLIIDLRDREEYEAGHIKNAVNMPYDDLLGHVCLPKNRLLVLYCDRGSLSMAQGKVLAKHGYRAVSVVGGMHAYRGKYLVK